MSVSQAGMFSIQEFADAGTPLASGRLYTYAYGTTTQKIAYTDAAGLIPHTYTLDASDVPYIALNSRGELPAPLYLLTDGSYDLALKRSDGSSVWTRRADGAASAATVALYAASGGSALVGFLQAGTGAVPRTAQDKLREVQVNAKDYGVVADGVTDDIAALDLATAAAISLKKKLVLPPGNISISRPWLLAKRAGTVYDFFSINVEGEKSAWDIVSGQTYATRIVPIYNNTFAIGIQMGRGVKLKDITVAGKNAINLGSGASAMVNANYVIAGCRDSRYSPYAGVVVDPFGATLPADGGYPGMSSFYAASAGGSAGTVFESVYVSNFVVGFLLSPSPNANLASEISFRTCSTVNNKVGFAICNNQSRNVHWYGGSVTTNLIGFDGFTYGNQTGYAPGIFGCNMSGKYLFNVKFDGGNSLPMCGVHAEAFSSIGFFGTGGGSSRNPVEFIGCEFKFVDFGGILPDHHLVTGTNVNFIGGNIDVQGIGAKSPIRFYKDNASHINFHGTAFINHQLLEYWMAFSGQAQHPSQGVNFRNCSVSDSGGRGPGSGLWEMGGDQSSSDISNPNRSVQPLGTSFRFNNSTASDFYKVGNSDSLARVSLGALVVTLGASSTATFTVADGAIIRTGDMIYTSTTVAGEGQDMAVSFNDNWMCLGLVSAVSVNDITISGVPQNLANGTYTLFSVWWPRYHQPTTGDTSTSVTIANVNQPGAWKVGNKIQGAGIVAGTYITAIVGTTFTLSKATTATAVGVRLFDADIYKFSGTAV